MDRNEALKRSKDPLEFYHNADPKCPHCGHDYSVRENEAWHLYSDDERHTVECSFCETEFDVLSYASWSFSTDEQEDYP